MMEYIWVLTMLVVLTGKFAQCFEYEVSSEERLIFGEMTTFMHTDLYVYSMAVDEYIPGNILFSDQHSLKTTDGITMTTITGSPMFSGYQNGIGVQAYFRYITGFLQVTSKEVLIIDCINHCICWLDRRNASVSDFAGKCKNGGYVDGMGTTARFQRPTSALRDTRNTNHVVISDRYNNALRVLDVRTASVSTLLKSDSLNIPWAFTYDPTDEYALLITTKYGIQKLFLPVMSREDISGGSVQNFKDGSLKDARYNLSMEILPLHDQVYVVADNGNRRLRVLDLLNDKVFSICTGIAYHLHGPVSECELLTPYALLLIGNNLYIGAGNRIRSLPVSLEKIKVTATITPATTATTTTSDIGGEQMTREKIPLESAAGLPAAETLQGKDNALVIGVSVPLSVLSICAVVALIAFAIRKRRSNTARAQSTSNVSTGALQGQRSVYYSRGNEMFSLQERPPPYELHHIPSQQIQEPNCPFTPHPPQIVPEVIYQNCDVESQSTPSAPNLSSLHHAP